MKVTHITTSDMSLKYLLLDQLQFLATKGHMVSAVCGPGVWVDDVRRAGIPVTTLPLTRRIAPAEDAGAFGALIAYLRRERPDVIHTHTPKASLLGQWASALTGIRHRVHTIHGLYFPGHMRPGNRWRYVWLERLQMAPAHLILSQNAEDLETVRRERIADPSKVLFLGNGIDIARFTPANATPAARRAIRAELGIAEGEAVVGMVGRLVREKGYPELFEAAAVVLRSQPRTTFVLIGGAEPAKADGISADDPLAQALGPKVRWLGHRTDLVRLYGAMDLLVLPSHREGFPRAPMEAAATGIPVVATDIRGCRDTVISGVTGYLVPLGNVAALADALLDVLGDADRRQAMGRQGRLLAERRFDQRIVFQRVADAYARLSDTNA